MIIRVLFVGFFLRQSRGEGFEVGSTSSTSPFWVVDRLILGRLSGHSEVRGLSWSFPSPRKGQSTGFPLDGLSKSEGFFSFVNTAGGSGG